MNNYDINDIRIQKDFSGITFSGFKKSDVKRELIQSLLTGKIEKSCYWCAEYICAGHYGELWEIFLFFFGKHIHIGNPKIIIYLQKRFDLFRQLIVSADYICELHTRNSPKIRALFAEITCVLCFAKKTHSIETLKIKRHEEFDITNMQDNLHADSIEYVGKVYQKKDPKELMIPFNELYYNIVKKDCRRSSYWIEWLLEFDLLCRKKKQKAQCQIRYDYDVDNKYRQDIVWIIWDIFFDHVHTNQDVFLKSVLSALNDIFCIKYTTASCKKRRFLLYFAISLLTEDVNRQSEIMPKSEILSQVIENINTIYSQIKKNEHSPNTDYLFANVDKQSSIEKSLLQMDMLNSVDSQRTNT